MINNLIVTALTPLGVPVYYLRYYGPAVPTYITFYYYNEQGEAWAENEEIATGYYVQIDVWSKSDFITLVEQVKSEMKAAGFIRTSAIDFYEYDTQIYHRAIRFYYVT